MATEEKKKKEFVGKHNANKYVELEPTVSHRDSMGESKLNSALLEYLRGMKLIENLENMDDVFSEAFQKTEIKKHHELYNKDGSVKHDKRFKRYRKNTVNESILDEVTELANDVEAYIEEQKMVAPIPHSPTTVPDFVEPSTPDIAAQVSKHNKHHLGVGLNLKHMIQHAIKSRDIDDDGDVDPDEKIGKEEFGAGVKNSTKSMQAKYNAEKKHTKVGVAFESVEHNKPSDREWGTDSLTRIYKNDTPGQEVEESKNKGLWYNIRKRREKGLLKKKPGEEGYPKTLDIEETTTRGFEGKLIDIKNVPVRLANGKMASLPPGKSSSSKGGDGGE